VHQDLAEDLGLLQLAAQLARDRPYGHVEAELVEPPDPRVDPSSPMTLIGARARSSRRRPSDSCSMCSAVTASTR